MIETRFSSDEVDVLMIAEGTFPYARGGVASWISDMIEGMSEYKFGIIFLGAYKGLYEDYAYALPSNLVHLQIVYLFDNLKIEPSCPLHPKASEKIDELHHNLQISHGNAAALVEPIPDLNALLSSSTGFDYYQFLRSQESWACITKNYSQFSSDPSFINYFWNIRNMHEPLWALHQLILAPKPSFKVIHTISTGYAGLLATMLHQQSGRPFLLTEHGLYSKERNIELLQTSMFHEADRLLIDKKTFSYEHQLWVKFYDSLARIAYQESIKITCLFEGARKQQLISGAPADKTMVIPNGIKISTFSGIRAIKHNETPKIACFVGRVARIKDIMTFIRSIQLASREDDEIQGWIKSVGKPDSEYLQECIQYIEFLGMSHRIHFIEEGGMKEILEQVGVLILTSISEGMPLVLLESLAAGIPVIATDVGACKEIIDGCCEEDKRLGSCGAVVTISDASTIAQNILALLNNEELWRKAHNVGIERVETYYNQPLMFSRYKALYEEAIAWQA